MLDGPRLPPVRSFSIDLTTGESGRANPSHRPLAPFPSPPTAPRPAGCGATRVLALPALQVSHQLVDGIGVACGSVFAAEHDLRPPAHPDRGEPPTRHAQAVPGDRVDDDPLVARARQLLGREE